MGTTLTSQKSSALTAARIGAVFVGYSACLAVLSWPLAASLTTHLPHAAGIFVSDLYYAGWALAWQTHALTTDPARFADANIYGGAPRALFYGTPGFGLLPIFGPVFAVSANPTLALNVALLGSLAATATSLHVVVAAWTGSQLAAVASAGTFLTAPAALGLCSVFPQYAALAGIPLIVWLLARDRLGWRGAIVLAALVAVQALTDVVYVAVPVVLTVGLAAIVRLLRARSRADGWRIVAALAAAMAALAPIYAQFLSVRAANPELRSQSVWGTGRALWIDPTTWLPLDPAPLKLDLLVFAPPALGVLAAALLLRDAGPARWRPWRQAALWFVTSLAVSWVLPILVPGFLTIVGTTMARDVTRLGFPALLGACLLVGLGFAAFTASLRDRSHAAVAAALPPVLLVLWMATRLEHFPWDLGRYPIERAPVPGAEAAVLRERRGHVLELPIGDPRTDTNSQAVAMYRSTGHWRPLLNGYASYQPHGFRERMDLVRKLPDLESLLTLRRTSPLTTIVVRASGVPARTTGRWRKAMAAGELPGLRIEYADDDVLVVGLPVIWQPASRPPSRARRRSRGARTDIPPPSPPPAAPAAP